MSNIDKAAEHLGANALKMIKLILLKHDAAIIEASQEAIEDALAKQREKYALMVEKLGAEGYGSLYIAACIRLDGEEKQES